MRRMMFCLTFGALLFAMSSPATANVEGVRLAPAQPSPGDICTLYVDGYWPYPGYTFQEVSAAWVADTFNVMIRAYAEPDLFPVIVPWSFTFPMGQPDAGWHHHHVTEIVTFGSGRVDTGFVSDSFLVGSCEPCITGDMNLDSELSVSDLTRFVAYMFRGGTLPCADGRANIDGSAGGEININDLVYFVAYFFRGGPPPVSCEP